MASSTRCLTSSAPRCRRRSGTDRDGLARSACHGAPRGDFVGGTGVSRHRPWRSSPPTNRRWSPATSTATPTSSTSDGTTITRVSVTGRGWPILLGPELCVRRRATTAPSWRSCRRPPTSCPATRTRRPTSSSATASPAPPSGCPIAAGFEIFDADWVTISHDGRFIAYNRGASFLYDRFNGTTQTVSAATPGGSVVVGRAAPRQRRADATSPTSRPRSFDPADTNSFADVYRFDRITGAKCS